MATQAMRSSNKSLRMITTIQYPSSLNNIINKITNIEMENHAYKIISYDDIMRIMHVVYQKRLILQNIYIILKEVNEVTTNVTIEVINDKSMVTTNYEHRVRIGYIIKNITKHLEIM